MLITFTVCLLCWSTGYIYSIGFPLTVDSAVFSFWEALCKLLNHRFFIYIIGLLLLTLTAFVMQRISDIEMLIRERTRLPFMLFMLLISTNAGLLPFREVSVVLLCLVFMIYELFNSYQSPEATGKLFNAGVLVGTAGLFMPQVLWFVPLLWIGMYQFRSLSFRSFMASLIGLLIIYWFVLAWCVWKHDFSMFVSLFSSLMDFELFSIAISFQYYQIGFIGIVLLLIMALFHIKIDAFNNSVRVRQMLFFLLNMSVWSLILIFLYGNSADSFSAILYLPGSVLIAYFLESMHNRFRFILYYSVLVLCVVSFVMRVWNF
ncbi:MAG: DUF6427 family protein [Tannerella sp.]|jgi:hypothetical protein|nr:DUF6427 family protein [Tannerella sp.]